jgi:tripartite-type tricarboxylate transporter receptor subunit TctC
MRKFQRTLHAPWWLPALVGLMLAVLFAASAGAASSYPNRPIDMVVGFGPGGAADVAARLVAGYVSKKWDQPINVVNMPGASGIIGTRHVIVAKADGYTLMMDNHAASAMLAATQMDLPFKWDNRTPVALVTLDPVFYTAKLDAPWKTLKEVAEHVKKNPKVLRYGTSGVTAVGAFSVPQFLDANQLSLDSMNKVVFKSGGEVMTALAGGHIDFAGQQYSESTGLILAKKVKAYAVVNSERLSDLPDIPTAKEVGFPTLDIYGWQGVSGPPKLPKEVVEKWARTLEAACKDPAFLEQGRKIYKVIRYMGPTEFSDFQQAEYKRYLPLATRMGIRGK